MGTGTNQDQQSCTLDLLVCARHGCLWLQRLNRLIRGRLNYFKLANIHGKLQALDSWLRKRVRYCIWSRKHTGEETGTHTEKPDAYWCETRRCLCMEPDTDGRLASSAKPHSENDHHLRQDEEKGLYRYVGTLSSDQAKVANRPDPSGWCERRTVNVSS